MRHILAIRKGRQSSTGNIALRHDLGIGGTVGTRGAWKIPSEGHGAQGWRITGSLLGLDVALARMALRRLDSSVMPPEPRLVSAERQTAALTVALSNPATLSDATRDEIAAALGRGRARLAALDGDRAEHRAVAHDAGLSALASRGARMDGCSRSRASVDAACRSSRRCGSESRGRARRVALDGWGAAMLPLNGCVCLAMPRARPWEPLSGRPSLGLLATSGADVAILVAETLASLKMPAEIAPRRDRLRDAGGRGPGAALLFRRLARVQPRRRSPCLAARSWISSPHRPRAAAAARTTSDHRQQ